MALTKKGALAALAVRRKANAKRKKINNDELPAGAPMYFYCLTCDAEIIVPESYQTRSKLCGDCQALKDLGWLA